MKIQGFDNDGEFINVACGWIHSRVTRLALEKKLRDAEHAFQTGDDDYRGTPAGKLRCQVMLAREAEEKLYSDMEARLDAHRVEPGLPLLGVDRVTEESHLINEERLLLLTALIPAISQPLAEQILGNIGSFYASVSVSDLIQILDPKGPGDWIAARQYFQPKAPLIRDGHLVLDTNQGDIERPDNLLTSDVFVSMKTFVILTGSENGVNDRF